MRFKLQGITRNVVVLGLVSFLGDVSSEMIYPLLPLFLSQTLGAGKSFIGLIEGVAEASASFFTLYSGVQADRVKDRSKLVLAGYALSSFVRPLVALATSPWAVLATRFTDRMGKGIRTSPRDAILAESVAAEHRGKAFGLQRSMDNAGAILGPIIASLLLAGWVTNLRVLFALAAIPGILAVLLVAWKVRDVRVHQNPQTNTPVSFRLPSGRLRIFLAIHFIFMLSSSSDAFLLLRCGELGIVPALIPMVWMTFNMVKALTTLPLSALSDVLGRRKVLLMGWLVYSAIYAAFAWAHSAAHAWMLFTLYGIFYGFTEGTERALLADYSDPEERGRVYGWFYLLTGTGSLIASLFFGVLWQRFGPHAAFITSSLISTTAVFMLFIFMTKYPSPNIRASVNAS